MPTATETAVALADSFDKRRNTRNYRIALRVLLKTLTILPGELDGTIMPAGGVPQTVTDTAATMNISPGELWADLKAVHALNKDVAAAAEQFAATGKPSQIDNTRRQAEQARPSVFGDLLNRPRPEHGKLPLPDSAIAAAEAIIAAE